VTAQLTQERDLPKGHPKAADYVPGSPDALDWARRNIHPAGERDFPVGHPKALDTTGNTNHVPIRIGVDPANPHLEEFSGATPEVVKAQRKAYLSQLPQVKETPTREDGFVDVTKIMHENALQFLCDNGHTEEEAAAIIAAQGIDKILAAKHTLGVKE
jgi:hypothetical protein